MQEKMKMSPAEQDGRSIQLAEEDPRPSPPDRIVEPDKIPRPVDPDPPDDP